MSRHVSAEPPSPVQAQGETCVRRYDGQPVRCQHDDALHRCCAGGHGRHVARAPEPEPEPEPATVPVPVVELPTLVPNSGSSLLDRARGIGRSW